MDRLKAVLKKIFFLPPLPTVLIAIPSFLFVFVMLGIGDHSAFAYIAYILSAYALIITITGLPGVMEAIRSGIDNLTLFKKIRSTALGGRLLGDDIFRSEITLHGGLFVNLLYAAINLFSGIRYRSAWFVALAFYYALLSAMRAVLVRYVHRKPVGAGYSGRIPALPGLRCYPAFDEPGAGRHYHLYGDAEQRLFLSRPYNLCNGNVYFLYYDFSDYQCNQVPEPWQSCDVGRQGHQPDRCAGFHAFAGNRNARPVWQR